MKSNILTLVKSIDKTLFLFFRFIKIYTVYSYFYIKNKLFIIVIETNNDLIYIAYV